MRRLLHLLALACLLGETSRSAAAAEIVTNSAESLRTHYEVLAERLDDSQFHQPLYLDSAESAGTLTGDIYARVAYPFAVVEAALKGPTHWCDVLILHVNTKYCHASTRDGEDVLTVNIGAKHEEPIEDTHRLEFTYRVTATAPEYFQVQLDAAKGPLATRDYRILMEAVSLGDEQTFLHFSYSYSYGLAGRLAMNTYLATVARGKVGFTIIATATDGAATYIRGVRGLVERNTMRYYLAIDAYLSAVAAPPAEQLEQRLQHWFDGTERYPRQLHEVDREAYLVMKRNEYARQQTTPTP